MVVSATNGRVRVRHGALKGSSTAGEIRGKLLEMKGVLDVQINRRVGSLLVMYDKAKISLERILNKVAEVLHVDLAALKSRMSQANKALTGVKGRRYVKRGMLGALGTAMVALVWTERYHVVAGGVFLGLLGLHLYQNKRTLAR